MVQLETYHCHDAYFLLMLQIAFCLYTHRNLLAKLKAHGIDDALLAHFKEFFCMLGSKVKPGKAFCYNQ